MEIFAHLKEIQFEAETAWIPGIYFPSKCAQSLYSDAFNPEVDTIEFSEDTLQLLLMNESEIACTEQRCDSITYRIENPENKIYHIKKW